MPPKVIDRVGLKAGRLTVIRRAESHPPTKWRGPWWVCQCECGNQAILPSTAIVNRHTLSCGCLQRETRLERCRKASAIAHARGCHLRGLAIIAARRPEQRAVKARAQLLEEYPRFADWINAHADEIDDRCLIKRDWILEHAAQLTEEAEGSA